MVTTKVLRKDARYTTYTTTKFSCEVLGLRYDYLTLPMFYTDEYLTGFK